MVEEREVELGEGVGGGYTSVTEVGKKLARPITPSSQCLLALTYVVGTSDTKIDPIWILLSQTHLNGLITVENEPTNHPCNQRSQFFLP